MMTKLCNVEQCSKAIHDWFLWNGLALNPDKTELLLLDSTAKLRHINCENAVNIAGADVSLVDLVKSVTVDSRLTFDKHVNKMSVFVFSYSCTMACHRFYVYYCHEICSQCYRWCIVKLL